MAGIFISYRRSDASGYAGRLYEGLVKRFGKSRIFMDIDTLQPGLDFGRALDDAVAGCDVLIALIGPGWLTAANADGHFRLENPGDYVRLEIATALSREGVRVIPVLVGQASLPKAEALPEELRSLVRRHAYELSDHRWEYDLQRLAAALEQVIRPTRRPGRERTASGLKPRTLGISAVAVATLALALTLGPDWGVGGSDPPPTPAERSVIADMPTLEPSVTPTAPQAQTDSPTATNPDAPPTLGLESGTSYRSPQFGYTVTWTDAWMPDQSSGASEYSDGDEDGLFLASTERYLLYLQVFGEAATGTNPMEKEFYQITNPDYLTRLAFDNHYTVLMIEQGTTAGGVVVL
jgi:hypothetical protein